ncbi:antitoxin [Cryobacterium sinapicolor]|uniref:Antitoxin n=1 Tax=Cryobacterium sinapicolor TaxID=1259236 RepID=A0ABY2JFL0_9MICO|nr:MULTISPECIES: Rv0909 family putative TA system antitoxin [Cryobacterium]TFC87986.1 antitoxin [Cryobacterium sp. TMT3-29-2]TFD04755.1 antitoxin [Cryobacterium sinapicolor]
MNFNDISRKAQEFLKTEKGEKVADKILDGGAAAANKVTGNKHADKIQDARDKADKHLGRGDGPTDRGAQGTDPDAR